MPQILFDEGERGEYGFTYDGSLDNRIFYTARARVSNFNTVGIDFSDRRNPRWYTLGHVSISSPAGTLLWETWLNYPDQAWGLDEVSYPFAEGNDLGMDIADDGASEDYQIPIVVAWQMRDLCTLEFWLS
jgi:hypothetical protein